MRERVKAHNFRLWAGGGLPPRGGTDVEIVAAVLCRASGCVLEAIRSRRRSEGLAYARHALCYALATILGEPQWRIGQFIHRTQAAVGYGVACMRVSINTYPQVKMDMGLVTMRCLDALLAARKMKRGSPANGQPLTASTGWRKRNLREALLSRALENNPPPLDRGTRKVVLAQ